MQPDQIKTMIAAGLPDSEVTVTGDGRHFEAVVVCDAFAGKAMLQQHRMVYATVGDKLATEEIHALSVRTYTRAEWTKKTG